MTAIVAIAVNPEKDHMPYFLIYSDSKKVLKQEDENGILKTIAVDEDYKKIFKVGNDRAFGLAGKFEDYFIGEFERNLSSAVNLKFEEFSQYAFELIKGYIKEQPFNFARCNVIIGENRSHQPKIAQFLVIKNRIEESILNIGSPEKGNAFDINIGNTKGMTDLYEAFQKRVRNAINYNPFTVKRAAREYISGVADRLPNLCNHNVKFIKI